MDSKYEGNAAMMREALLIVKRLFDSRIMFQPAIRKAHKAVDAALAAPPRVCDVNTLESLSDFVEKTILTSNLLKDTHEIVKSIVVASVRTALTIAYEPAKEMKAKEGDVHA